MAAKSLKGIDYSKIETIVDSYEKNFDRIFDGEKYKIAALEQFNDYWDISTADFADMLEKACITTIEEGKLIMATNAFFPPYEYYEGDKIVGIDVEIATAVADKLGLELVIEDVEFDSIIAGVQSGKYDIGCAGMTVTEDRLKSVNFSTPYATGIQSIIVAADSEITDIDTLVNGDYKVGVQSGTTGDIYMSAPVEEGGVGEERIERFAKGNDAVIALTTGKISAVVIDNKMPR